MLDYLCQVYHKLSGCRRIFLFMVKHSILLYSASSLWWRCFLVESSVADFQTPRIWINNLTISCIAIFVLFTLHSNNLGDNDLLQSLSLCWQEQRSVIIFYLVAFCTFVSACSVLPALHKSSVSRTCFFGLFFSWKRYYSPYMLLPPLGAYFGVFLAGSSESESWYFCSFDVVIKRPSL